MRNSPIYVCLSPTQEKSPNGRSHKCSLGSTASHSADPELAAIWLTATFRWHSLFRIPTQPPCVHERHLVCGPRDWHGGCYGTIIWSAISLALRLCFATGCTRCPVQRYLGSQLKPWSHCDAPANANRAMIPCITHPQNINTRTYP